ncbi:MAG TPA: N-formylglutamate amidohydrolase [Steroidobacteraceae bacterium]|nr:N-formylglutamate amidohydrolase [Steroidobacteraceae bacterium]
MRQFHAPYHACIDTHLDTLLALGVRPTLISVHSFSPTLGSVARPRPVTVLWKRAREPVAALLDWFVAHGFLVGDNRPYDARILFGWTLEHHALRRDLPHVLLEIRSDRMETPQAQRAWGRGCTGRWSRPVSGSLRGSPNNLGASTGVIAQLRAPGRGRRRRDQRLSPTLCDAAAIISRLWRSFQEFLARSGTADQAARFELQQAPLSRTSGITYLQRILSG